MAVQKSTAAASAAPPSPQVAAPASKSVNLTQPRGPQAAPGSRDGFAAPPPPAAPNAVPAAWQASPLPANVTGTLRQNFQRLDRNSDGRLSREELDQALQDANVRGDVADAVAGLKATDDFTTRTETIAGVLRVASTAAGPAGMMSDYVYEKHAPPGVSESDLDRLEADPEGKQLEALDTAMEQARDQRLEVARGAIFATGTPKLEGISQGFIGDCYFVSAVAGLTQARPRDVMKMIEPDGTGGATVRLGNGYTSKISAPTDGELGYLGTSRGDGTWYTLIEKAYGKFRNDGRLFGRHALPVDEASDGGQPAQGIEAVTGHSATTFTMLFTTKARVRSEIDSALAEHRVVTAGTSPFGGSSQLVASHAYTVIAYDRDSDTVTVRNPWGGNGERAGNDGVYDDGRVVLSLDDFWSGFRDIAVEDRTVPST